MSDDPLFDEVRKELAASMNQFLPDDDLFPDMPDLPGFTRCVLENWDPYKAVRLLLDNVPARREAIETAQQFYANALKRAAEQLTFTDRLEAMCHAVLNKIPERVVKAAVDDDGNIKLIRLTAWGDWIPTAERLPKFNDPDVSWYWVYAPGYRYPVGQAVFEQRISPKPGQTDYYFYPYFDDIWGYSPDHDGPVSHWIPVKEPSPPAVYIYPTGQEKEAIRARFAGIPEVVKVSFSDLRISVLFHPSAEMASLTEPAWRVMGKRCAHIEREIRRDYNRMFEFGYYISDEDE